MNESMYNYEKSGYLTSDYKLFHLQTTEKKEISYHYHDFHKILIFLGGNVTYHIEGRSFKLRPFDVVFVNAGDVHKPEINDDSVYQRIIAYVSTEFFQNFIASSDVLRQLYDKPQGICSHVLPADVSSSAPLFSCINGFRDAFLNQDFGYEDYINAMFIQFFVLLNRAYLKQGDFSPASKGKVTDIIDYINGNLTCDLSVDALCSIFFISRSRLMHLFKEETGLSVGQYIANKRLLLARSFIHSGMSRTQACYQCGYNNYSTFTRAYNKLFKKIPAADID